MLWSHSSNQQPSIVAPVEEEDSSPVAAVKGAIKEGGKKSGSGCVRSIRPKTQLKALDEEKIKRQLESGLCYTHYRYGPAEVQRPALRVAIPSGSSPLF